MLLYTYAQFSEAFYEILRK